MLQCRGPHLAHRTPIAMWRLCRSQRSLLWRGRHCADSLWLPCPRTHAQRRPRLSICPTTPSVPSSHRRCPRTSSSTVVNVESSDLKPHRREQGHIMGHARTRKQEAGIHTGWQGHACKCLSGCLSGDRDQLESYCYMPGTKQRVRRSCARAYPRENDGRKRE